MADLGLQSFTKLYPMVIKKYQDLVVDQNANEADKINSIIQKLNALGKLSNDVVRDWNTVYQWAMNDGLSQDVSNKVEEMKANGELNTVLQGVFLALAGDMTTLHTSAKNTLVNSINEVDDLAKANQTAINTNTTNIATNTANIATNTTNIASNTSALAEIATQVYVESYPKQSGETDDTARIQRAINSAPEYSTLVFGKGLSYTITNLVFTKSLNVNLNGANLTLKPETNADGIHGNPAFWFKGTLGSSYSFGAIGQYASNLTLSTSGTGTNFSVGQWVIVGDNKTVASWNGGAGYGGRQELTFIKSISGDTLTMGKPLEWDYSTGATITPITKILERPKIFGSGIITNPDVGTAYDGNPLVGNCPHLFHFQYCMEPSVKDCTFNQWNVHCVNFNLCYNAKVEGCSAYDPYRPQNSGNAYFMRFDHCTGGVAKRNTTRKVRHTVDLVQSYDCASEYNVAVNGQVTDYECHGLGNKRYTSSFDTSHGCDGTGWGVGNETFNADYDTTILNPKYMGSNTAIYLTAYASDIRIVNPEINTVSIGILATKGATGLHVSGGKITLIGSYSGGIGIQGLKDSSSGLGCGNITLRNIDLYANGSANNNVVQIASNGKVDIEDIRINSTGAGTMIYIDSTLTPTDIIIDKVRITGSYWCGIQTKIAPANQYKVNGCFISGYNTNASAGGINLTMGNNLQFQNNKVIGASTQYVFSSSLTTAVSNGAINANNSPAAS